MGYKAGYSSTGASNTFVGFQAGMSNTSGGGNAYVGYGAGLNGGTSSWNAAFGVYALSSALTATNAYCSAFGAYALKFNTGGAQNTASGYSSLYYNTSGNNNTASGYGAGANNTTGSQNTFLGTYTGGTNTTGSNNTFVGYLADVTTYSLTNCTAIGNGAVGSANNSVTLGNSAITKIYAAVTTITLSDGRFKNNIKENVKGLAFINKLRPVTYNVDTKKLDDYLIQNMPDSIKALHRKGMDFSQSTAIVHSGFVAQEVEQAGKDVGFESSIVSSPDNSDNPYGLGYEEFVVPLVKAVQELSEITDSLTTVKTQQDSTIKAQNLRIADIENQLNKLISTVNACCTARPKSLEGEVGQINVDLNNLQTIVLAQNAPNPFAEQTTINYFLPDNAGKAQMLFYDVQGMLIQSVDLIQKGKGALNVFANDLTNGIYTYTLVVDGKIMDSKKMVKQ